MASGSIGAVGTSACVTEAEMAGWVSASASASESACGGTSIGRPFASQNSRRFWALVVTSGSSAGRARAAMAWARRYSRSASSIWPQRSCATARLFKVLARSR
jgi:hypothetical protein